MNKPGYEITEGDRCIFNYGEFNSIITDIEYLKKTKIKLILTIGFWFLVL